MSELSVSAPDAAQTRLAAIRSAVRDLLRSFRAPHAVYRLQLSPRFTFRQAAEIIPYLRRLGIGAVYTSPFFQAVPGSPHGYNVTDPNAFNPELGGAEGYEIFSEALREHGMLHVIDVVPNHMGVVGNNNRLWLDVLENGPSSIYAHFFDIDWDPVKKELKNKVLIPILGDWYGRVLENGDIRLVYSDGEFTVRYYDHSLPVAPTTYPFILESGLEELERRLSKEDPDFLEILSVITAFRRLPGIAERDAAKIAERNREKEIAKRRLTELVGRSSAIREYVESRVVFFNGQKDNPHSFDRLDELLDRQAYRVAHWMVASEEINYRRFFNINELAAVRMEDPRVFDYCHELVFGLIAEGRVQGLRIDHPDGLYDPPAYFARLQKRFLKETLEASLGAEASADIEAVLAEPEFKEAAPLYVVVEKILERDERLPRRWRVQGTVGYDFLNFLNGLFIAAENQRRLNDVYEGFIGHRIDLDQLVYDTKNSFAMLMMASEINSLGERLDRISERNRHYRDFTRNNLTLAIRVVIGCFPVYRTYVGPGRAPVSERDEKYIRLAVECAKRRTPALNPAIYDFLRDALLVKLSHVGDDESGDYRDFALRFQQLTAPVMAKGLEDTAFYVNNRLLSLNEVGGDPACFGSSIDEFHARNAERAKSWPYSFLATSTHDTKRSQDARMRLDVLSEIPDEWSRALAEWGASNAGHKTEIDGVAEPRPNTEYFIYQTILAVWPDHAMDAAERETFTVRVWQSVQKSVREAKIYTNWTAPDLVYEAAVEKFVRGILLGDADSGFLKSFRLFESGVSRLGKWNSLSALVLKLGSPGVPDTYQGDEMWDYTLVDPDNRRPVDFGMREALLSSVEALTRSGRLPEAVAEFARSLDDGRLKLFVLRQGLLLRSEAPDLFSESDYAPLKTEGPQAGRLVAFWRRKAGKNALVAAGRHFAHSENPAGEIWRGTRILLPPGLESGELEDIFTGSATRIRRNAGAPAAIDASDLFRVVPFAVLTDFWRPS